MSTISKYAAALLLVGWSAYALAQNYTISELGQLPEVAPISGRIGAPLAINNKGQIAGYSYLKGTGYARAMVWNGTTPTDIGTLGGMYSWAEGINDKGQVVGMSSTSESSSRAFIWDGTTLTDLGTLGGIYGDALAINNAGEVVGASDLNRYSTFEVATIWNGTTPTDLGTPFGGDSAALGVNAAGQVVGASSDPGDVYHAIVWEGTTVKVLPSLGGNGAVAVSINASGQVVGYSDTENDTFHATLWNGAKVTDLGTLGTLESRANGINDAGQIVGATYPDFAFGTALLWQDGKLIDLNTLVIGPLAAHVTLVEATAINNGGSIVGVGVDNLTGVSFGFLLNPIRAPLTLACPEANAQVGVSYNSALTATGGTVPYTFSSTGHLPEGLTLNASTGAIIGIPTTVGGYSFTAKVMDYSGSAAGTVTASCTVTIRPAPSFSISALPASLSIAQGSAGTSLIITKALNGFAGDISLEQSGAPKDTSITFMPTAVSAGGMSRMQITVGAGAAVGTYTVTVTGKSGVLSHTTTVSMTITPAPLKLSVTPSSLSFDTVTRFSLRFKSVTVKNIGTKTVALSRVSVTPGTGTGHDDFTPINLCGRTLDVGRSCLIIVVMFADDLGSLSATLNISSDAVTGTQSVPLSARVN
jgi:probable HAF family extracellular repeat protein